jgi:hypothetical protein
MKRRKIYKQVHPENIRVNTPDEEKEEEIEKMATGY